jgi:hypothetical protein
MPRKDIYHDNVKAALEKDGWRAIDDPLRIVAGGVGLFIDLTAEPIISFERENKKIAIEIKSFEIQSQITSFYEALSKYITYRKALEMNEMDIEIYLAIPKKAFDTLFQKELVKAIVKENKVYLIVYEPDNQIITSWIKL